MVTNRKQSGKAMSIPAGILLGTAISMVISILGSMLTAWLLTKETIRENGVGYAAMVILVIASLAGCLTAVGKIKHQRLMVCGLSGISYFAALIAVTALFFGGQYSGVGATALLIFGSCAVVAILGLKENNSFVNRRKKKAYR